MKKIWKDIAGYEGLYQVSNYGRVRCKKKNGYRLLKIILDDHGYPIVRLYLNKIGITKKVHRLLMLAFVPNPENKYAINHINGVPGDNRIQNLEWCSLSENTKHAYKIGLKKPITRDNCGFSKINQTQFDDLVNSLFIDHSHINVKQLANKYSLTRKRIEQIRRKYIFESPKSLQV